MDYCNEIRKKHLKNSQPLLVRIKNYTYANKIYDYNISYHIFLSVHPLGSFKHSVIRAFICVFICMCCMLISAEIVCLRQMNELLFASMANMPIWQPCHIPKPITPAAYPKSPPDSSHWHVPLVCVRCFMCDWLFGPCSLFCAYAHARLIKIINQSCYFAMVFYDFLFKNKNNFHLPFLCGHKNEVSA